MDFQALHERIDEVSTKLRYLQRDITALHYFDMKDLNCYSSLLYASAINGEHIVNNLRRLVFETTDIPKREYLAKAASELDISITENNGMVEITIPCLLPRRKSKSTDFIIAPLQAALSDFSWEHLFFDRFKRCVICFSHVYDSARRKRGGLRDHDNIEIKPIVDSINLFLLTDDAGSLCNIFHASEIGDKDMTRITIMKCDMFSEWILHQKSMS